MNFPRLSAEKSDVWNSRDKFNVKATPHKARLTTLHKICLHFFRHLAQKSLDIRQYACKISVQSDEKTDFASFAQALCGIALRKTAVNVDRRFPLGVLYVWRFLFNA